MPHGTLNAQDSVAGYDKVVEDLPVFPFIYSADDLRTYWSVVNVAVGLLLATAATFLATILTAVDPEIRSGRHYMAFSLFCFTTALLINLSHQISFATASAGIGRRKERRAEDMQVAKSYLQDNLNNRFALFFWPGVHGMQLDASERHERNAEERKEHKRERAAVQQERQGFAEESQAATRMHNAERGLRDQNFSTQSAECILQTHERNLQEAESGRQTAEQATQQDESHIQGTEWRTRQQEFSMRREGESMERESKSWKRERASRERLRQSVIRLQRARRNEIADPRELATFQRECEQANEQRLAAVQAREQMFIDYVISLPEILRAQQAASRGESSKPSTLQAFIRYQKDAFIQTFAFFTLITGLALMGATLIKIGLVIEGALIIVTTCGFPLLVVRGDTFLHFIQVPAGYYI